MSKEHPEWLSRDVIRELSVQWKALSEDEKASWKTKAVATHDEEGTKNDDDDDEDDEDEEDPEEDGDEVFFEATGAV